jgi:hypothetical protein
MQEFILGIISALTITTFHCVKLHKMLLGLFAEPHLSKRLITDIAYNGIKRIGFVVTIIDIIIGSDGWDDLLDKTFMISPTHLVFLDPITMVYLKSIALMFLGGLQIC